MAIRTTVLGDTERAAWLELIAPHAKCKGSVTVFIEQPFTVTIGGEELVVPASTELVFFHNLTGQYRGTRRAFRTEGVFYLNGATLSIRGYFGRKIPKGKEAQYARKVAEHRLLGNSCGSGNPPIGLLPALV